MEEEGTQLTDRHGKFATVGGAGACAGAHDLLPRELLLCFHYANAADDPSRLVLVRKLWPLRASLAGPCRLRSLCRLRLQRRLALCFFALQVIIDFLRRHPLEGVPCGRLLRNHRLLALEARCVCCKLRRHCSCVYAQACLNLLRRKALERVVIVIHKACSPNRVVNLRQSPRTLSHCSEAASAVHTRPSTRRDCAP